MKYLLCLFLGLWCGHSLAQEAVDWSLLSEVRFVQQWDLHSGYVTQQPRFPKAIKALDGQQIEISGHILPLDVEGKVYALSRYPYSACFFCGGAGLESVMDVWFADLGQRYDLDQQVKLRGTLRLAENGDGLIYLLEDAVEVE